MLPTSVLKHKPNDLEQVVLLTVPFQCCERKQCAPERAVFLPIIPTGLYKA